MICLLTLAFYLLLSFLSLPAVGNDTVCKALVLSGGASNGAWEAGVLWGLTHFGNEKDYSYDVVTGVSAGAINGAALALWPIGSERNATEFISQTWSNLTSDAFYDSKVTSWLTALFHKSVYNTDPAKKLIRGVLDDFEGFKRKFSVSAVDVQTGEIFTATEESVPYN